MSCESLPKEQCLIWIDWYAPGYKAGGPVSANVNLVRHLSDAIDFRIVTFDTEYCEERPYANLPLEQWLPGECGTVFYLKKQQSAWQKIRKIGSLCRRERHRIWYLNGVYSSYMTILPLLFARLLRPAKMILAPCGTLSPQSFVRGGFKKKLFLQLFRLIGGYAGVEFHATSQEEANHIRQWIGTNTTIHTENLLPPAVSGEKSGDRFRKDGILRLACVARVSEEKNTLFAIQVLTRCRKPMRLELYGQIYNQEYWTECCRAIAELPSTITVCHAGTLPPAELLQRVSEVDFMFLPTRGENFGYAIYESLLCGTPVIVSDRTPWRNLADHNVGWDLPLDQLQTFRDVLERAAELTREEYLTMCQDCRRFALKQLDITSLKRHYEQILKRTEKTKHD